ncbi:THAP domain-containing protein 11-like [Dermacentor albipictus]|uniref:THAP domain-containing protein 11-like n=1 Tax=Dermacentor albipictus TaxID=60249 RepID=UPI0038FC05EF
MSSKCRGGGQTCCVPGCDNNTLKDKNVSFHAFPANEKEKKEWVRRINRQGSAGRFSLWQPSKHHRICGAHFNASGRRGYMDRLPTIFPHKVINQLSPSFNTIAKRKKTSSQTASASPALLLNELDIGCVVDVPQCDQQSDVVSQEPTQLTFGAPASPRTETEGADHSYSMGPPDAASAATLRKVNHLLEVCGKLEHENSLLRKDKSVLQKEVEDLKAQLHDMKVQALKEKLKLKNPVSKVHDFVSDEKRLVFYTGFNSFKKFDAFVEHVEGMYEALKTGAGRPPALTMKEQLIAVLCRLRVGLLEQDLAYRLKVSVSTTNVT